MRELHEELGLSLPEGALRHAWQGSFPFEYRTDTLDIFEVDVQDPILPEVNHRELVWADWRTPEEARALPARAPPARVPGSALSGQALGGLAAAFAAASAGVSGLPYIASAIL